MRIIYLGTPALAVPTLERLISWDKGEVLALVTQPDRPVGRSGVLQPPPTKVIAQKYGIPVFQPERLSKAPDIVEAMQSLKPDVIVMVAFGQILKKAVLEMPIYGVVNLHGSILPKYRGAAPINWAIINGETVTGITTMFSDSGVDTGKLLLKQEIEIDPNMTAVELGHRMSTIGCDLVIKTLESILNGSLSPEPQDEALATYAPILTKELGKLEWTKSAHEIHNLVRGLTPWPGTYTKFGNDTLKIIASCIPDEGSAGACAAPAPGEIISIGERVVVACGSDGSDQLELIEVQPANRAKMKARDWANGARIKAGTLIGQ